MKVSIWIMWLGRVCGTLLLMIHLLSPHDVLKYISIVVAFMCVTIGSPGLIVNAIPFGTDQMLGASSEEISSFIHCMVCLGYVHWHSQWLLCGKRLALYWHGRRPSSSCVHALCCSSFITCSLLCRNWLVIEPVSQNPLKSIYSVLKYAATHKHPARRSALTYWEEDIPSRIDLGKSKYGGPFTTEQVEDVKTFFHLLVVGIAISFFSIHLSHAVFH